MEGAFRVLWEGEKGCGGRVGGWMIPRNAFKARLTALESLRTI